MKVLGFDLETTGVDSKTANILEVGAVLFDVVDGVWTAETYSHGLVFHEEYMPLNPEALKVNKLTEDQLRHHGVTLTEMIARISPLAHLANYVMAFNAQYDKGVLTNQLIRMNLHSVMTSKNWICALHDVEQFVGRKCRKLTHIAVDEGLLVDGEAAHGALADVRIMGDLANKLKLNPQELWDYKTSPTVVICTKVTPPWEDGKKDSVAAKECGYGWEGAGEKTYPKLWVKLAKTSKLHLEKRPYKIIEELPSGI